jgi:DNA-binding SARP family transcriptional activator
MAHLAISLLGPFQVTLNGAPVTRFGADTARALLAYLTLHPGVEHRRKVLAGLLWPERPDSTALRNLRVALSRVREAIGDRGAGAEHPFFLVTRRTIQVNPESDPATGSGQSWWVDVRAFRDALAEVKAHRHRHLEDCDTCAKQLSKAAELYRGEFLAEFSLNSTLFEQWLVIERERLHRQALDVLGTLAAYYEERTTYQEALRYARRQVELEPWCETAHRQWMCALALSGHRGAALAQYASCRHILAEELGVEPEEETKVLYERIREGIALQAPS